MVSWYLPMLQWQPQWIDFFPQKVVLWTYMIHKEFVVWPDNLSLPCGNTSVSMPPNLILSIPGKQYSYFSMCVYVFVLILLVVIQSYNFSSFFNNPLSIVADKIICQIVLVHLTLPIINNINLQAENKNWNQLFTETRYLICFKQLFNKTWYDITINWNVLIYKLYL